VPDTPQLASGCQRTHPTDKLSHRQNAARPSVQLPVHHLPPAYRAQSPPKQSAWPSLTKSNDTLPPALTHWPVGAEKHTSNGQILAQTLRLSPPVQLPVHHRSTHLPCSIAVKQVRMALSYLFERYLTFGTTSPACGCR
jgi:hypothetical protein